MIAKVFKVQAISLRILDTVEDSESDDQNSVHMKSLAAAKARAAALKTASRASSKVAAEQLSADVGAEKPSVKVKQSGWRLHERHLNSSSAWYLRAAVWAFYCVVIYW
jgi:hypothetical protein